MDLTEFETLVRRIAAGYEGDAYEAADALADDVVFRDGPDLLHGADDVRDHLLAYGSRRERFLIHNVTFADPVGEVTYTLAFRADAVAYGQEGTARVEVRDGVIASWDATWTEAEIDLAPWGGD